MEGLGQPSNKSCVFRNNEPNLMTFYDDQQITEDVVEFPPGTELVRIISLVRHTTKVVFIPLDYGRAPSSMPVSGPSPSVLITNVSFLLFPLYPPRAPQKRFLAASISGNSPSPALSVADAAEEIGQEWNRPVTASAKKTITPVRDFRPTIRRTLPVV